MSGGGGKGGESKQELDPEMKAMARKLFARGEKLAASNPVPYMGATMAAPSAATKTAWTNTNNAANLLGLGMAGDPSDGIKMKETTTGGVTGYAAHDGFQDTLKTAWEQYPERMRALNQLIPGLMNPAKSAAENVPNAPNNPNTQPQGPWRPGMPYDYTAVANWWRNNGGMGR